MNPSTLQPLQPASAIKTFVIHHPVSNISHLQITIFPNKHQELLFIFKNEKDFLLFNWDSAEIILEIRNLKKFQINKISNFKTLLTFKSNALQNI